jgi:hypothetical protein
MPILRVATNCRKLWVVTPNRILLLRLRHCGRLSRLLDCEISHGSDTLAATGPAVAKRDSDQARGPGDRSPVGLRWLIAESK